jgi:RND family efflux transporter MFP subunit
MNQGAAMAIGVVAVALAAGGGYWAGHRTPAGAPQAGTPATSGAAAEHGKQEKKLLYYRNPMGLPDTSPLPKKDPMGMDYIAVYAGGADDEPVAANQLRFSTEKIQKMGVRTEAAQLNLLDRTVRAAGRIEPDERRLFTIASKFEGYVERLHVNVTGQPVAKGQTLFEAYSPELVSAQREYAIAAQGVDALKGAGSETQTGMKQLAEASLQRLRNWDISDEQIKALAKTGATQRTLSFRSPASGIVMEKKAVQGMRFMPGEMLYQVADLSAVWVVADVFEQDLALVRTGAKAKVTINAYPDKVFTGTVTYVYPTLKPETRTVPVRVELANPGLLLKPGMFAQVEMGVSAKAKVVTVPLSAVIDSGTRQIVLLSQGDGRFTPREVKLGARSDTVVEVIEGVKEGELVVVAANFLIDAESNLKAAVTGFAAAPAAPAATASVPAAKSAGHQAQGVIDSIDLKDGSLSLHHGPVESLKWPAMTMEFRVANAALLKDLKAGDKISVEFVERQPGEWVITSVKK